MVRNIRKASTANATEHIDLSQLVPAFSCHATFVVSDS